MPSPTVCLSRIDGRPAVSTSEPTGSLRMAFGADGYSLELGDHPWADELRALGLEGADAHRGHGLRRLAIDLPRPGAVAPRGSDVVLSRFRRVEGHQEGHSTLTWDTWREIPAVVFDRRNLRKTVAVALVVGSILFGVNQLDVVLRGDATTTVWVKSALTYVVPFLVSNYGIIVASRTDRWRQ